MKLIFNKIFKNIFFIQLSFIIFWSVFSSRSLLFKKIDLTYLEDLFSHSQWSIPLSTRIMSDNELYQVAGYRLIKGDSAFSINPEVPPVAKYFYGLGILLFKNSFLISLFFYTLAIFLFTKISFKIFSNKNLARISIVLFCLSPILISQITQTMLDLPQLVFLLAHVLTLLHTNQLLKSKKSIFLIILSGISLGLFAACKIPILLLPILLADFLFIKKSKRFFLSFWIILIAGITYFLTYTPTLINHQVSLISWLKNQLWMINFYKISQLENNPFYYLSTIFIGRFRGSWKNSVWQQTEEWTILWTLAALATIKLKIKSFSKQNLSEQFLYINNIGFFILITWLFFPFWSRYFLLVLPFLLINLVKILENKKILLNSLKIISFIWFFYYLLPTPKSLINNIEEKFTLGNYQDIHHLIESDLNREQFYSVLKEIQISTQAENFSLNFIDKPKLKLFKDNYNLDIQIIYTTPVGIYQQDCQMPIKKQFGQWQLVWNWNCIYPNFQVGDVVETSINYANQGILFNQDGTILSEEGDKDFVIVNTQLIKSGDTQLVKDLTKIIELQEAQIEKLIYIDYKGSDRAPIGYVNKIHSEKLSNELKENLAITFEKRPGRIYNHNLDLTSINRIKLTERKYPQLFGENGGQLSYSRGTEKQILINKEPIDGENVILNDNLPVKQKLELPSILKF